MPAEKEFKVNEYLSLRLERGKTNIYVKDRLFRQCKFLMLSIPVDEIRSLDDIGSIDEAADILGWTYDGQRGVHYELDPETEFWGHCSNLQAWAENEYDTRLLHSNLSFSLLKALVDAGDPIALKVFKQEIALRFASGNPKVVRYLQNQNYLKYLTVIELETLLNNIEDPVDKLNIFKRLIDIMENTKILKEDSSVISEMLSMKKAELLNTFIPKIKTLTRDIIVIVNNIENPNRKFFAIIKLWGAVRNTELLNSFTPQIEALAINAIERIDEKEDIKLNNYTFQNLLNVVKNNWQFAKIIPQIIKLIHLVNYKIDAFVDLMDAIKETKLLDTLTPQIEALVRDFIDRINNNVNPNHKAYAFRRILYAIEGTKSLEEAFLAFSRVIANIKHSSDEGLLFRQFLVTFAPQFEPRYIIKLIDTIENPNGKLVAFLELLRMMEKNKILRENFSAILEMIMNMQEFWVKAVAFEYLLSSTKKAELLAIFTPQIEFLTTNIIESINNSENPNEKILSFIKLLQAVRNTELLITFTPQIEALGSDIIKLINIFENPSGIVAAFRILLRELTGTELLKVLFPAFLEVIMNMKEPWVKIASFREMIREVKETEHLVIFTSQIETLGRNIIIMTNNFEKSRDKVAAFRNLLRVLKGTKLLKNLFPAFSDVIMNMRDDTRSAEAFRELMNVVKETELLATLAPKIKPLTLHVIDSSYWHWEITFRDLLEVLTGTGILKEAFPKISLLVMNIEDFFKQIANFKNLLLAVEKTELGSALAPQIENLTRSIICNMEHVLDKDYFLREVLDVVKGTKLWSILILQLENLANDILKELANDDGFFDKYEIFINLLEAVKSTELLKNLFPAFERVMNIKSHWKKVEVLEILLSSVKETELWKISAPQIEPLAREFLEMINDMKYIPLRRVTGLRYLLNAVKCTELWSTFAPQLESLTRDILEKINDMKDDNSKFAYLGELLPVVKSTELWSILGPQIEASMRDVWNSLRSL